MDLERGDGQERDGGLPDAGDGEVPEVHGGDYGEDLGGVVRLCGATVAFTD